MAKNRKEASEKSTGRAKEKELRAKCRILFDGRVYLKGDVLPLYDMEKVTSWLNDGVAGWCEL